MVPDFEEDDQPSDEQLLLWAIEAAESLPPRRWLAKHGVGSHPTWSIARVARRVGTTH